MQQGKIFSILQSNHFQRKLLVLFAMCLVYFFSYFPRVAVPGTCFDELQSDFKTTASAIAALSSVFLYIYAIAQCFIGSLTDRFGGRRTMLVGGSILALASILFPLSHSLGTLYITRALLAVGASTIFLSLLKELNTLFNPRHFSMWLGFPLIFGYSGGLVGTYPFERAVSRFGWRDPLLIIGFLCLAALILTMIVFWKFPSRQTENFNGNKNYIGMVLKNKWTYAPVIAGAINFTIYFLFQGTLGKKMLTDCCAISSAKAASIMFGMMFLCMFFSSISGFISRMIQNRRKPIIVTGILITLTTTMLMALTAHGQPNYHIMGAGLLLIGITPVLSPIALTSAKEVNSSVAAATSIGLANGAFYMTVAVIINLAGFALDLFKEQASIVNQSVIYPVSAYRVILFGCAALSAVALVSAFFIRETKGAHLEAR